MTTKKSVALIIVLMMVLSALAGCSSTKTNTPGDQGSRVCGGERWNFRRQDS